MRNYIQTFWQSFDIFDGTDTLIGVQTRVSGTEEEAAIYAASLPASGDPYFVPQTAATPVFVLLDKAAIINALNSQAPAQNSMLIQPLTPRWGISYPEPATKAKPKPTWPSNDGYDLSKTPARRSSAVLNPLNRTFQLAQYLELIYSRLYEAHQYYAANLVLPVLKKVLNGTAVQEDIDKLFATLKRYGI